MEAVKTQSIAPAAEPRPISVIAAEILKDWGKNVSYACKPYLNAMLSLNSGADSYGKDSAVEIVSYFLANAGSYRGEKARALKSELKKVLPYAKKR